MVLDVPAILNGIHSSGTAFDCFRRIDPNLENLWHPRIAL